MLEVFILLAILLASGFLGFVFFNFRRSIAALEAAVREQGESQYLLQEIHGAIRKIELAAEKAAPAQHGKNKDYAEPNPATFNQIISALNRLNAQNETVVEEIEKNRIAIESTVKKLKENLELIEAVIRNHLSRKPVENRQDLKEPASPARIFLDENVSDEVRESVEPPANKSAETARTLPDATLRNILEPFKMENPVYEILRQLNDNGISKIFLRKVVEVYQIYCNNPRFERLWQPLENALKSSHGVLFKHAALGFNKNAAIGFAAIRKEEIFKLEEFEKDKIGSSKLEHQHKDIIIFELCPQIKLDNELIYNGKVIVS